MIFGSVFSEGSVCVVAAVLAVFAVLTAVFIHKKKK